MLQARRKCFLCLDKWFIFTMNAYGYVMLYYFMKTIEICLFLEFINSNMFFFRSFIILKYEFLDKIQCISFNHYRNGIFII